MKKTITVDFYRIEGDRTELPRLETAFGDLARVDVATRSRTIDRNMCRLEHCLVRTTLIEGEIMRARRDDLPFSIKNSEPAKPLELGEDEYLGSGLAFLYNPSMFVLAIERNLRASHPSLWLRYLKEQGGFMTLRMLPIIQPDALRKIDQLTDCRKLEIAVAAPGKSSVFADLDMSMAAFANICQTVPRYEIAVKLSLGNQRGTSLPLKEVKRLCVKIFQALSNRKVAKKNIIITGDDPHERTLVIDLLKDRLIYKTAIEENSRTLSYEKRKACLMAAYRDKIDDLTLMFGEGTKDGSKNIR